MSAYAHPVASVYARWCSQHLCNVHTCTCMVLTTPVEMHVCSPQKMHMLSCMRAYATVQKLLCHRSYCELILSLVRASSRLSFTFALLSSRWNHSPDAVRSRNLFRSMLAHDAVAAAVSHKHQSTWSSVLVQAPFSLSMGRTPVYFVCGSQSVPTGMCCFVLLNRYWGIVTVPGFKSPRVNRPQKITWGLPDPHPSPSLRRWLYWSPPLPLWTDPATNAVDKQGQALAASCLGRSKVRSASQGRALSNEKST